MRTAAILPVKRFARAKQRLGASVADPLRLALARGDGRRRARRARGDRGRSSDDRRDPRALGRRAPARAGGAIVIEDAQRERPVARPRRSASRARWRRASSGCCACPATARRSTRRSWTRAARRGTAPGRPEVVDRPRPPRHRHQRAAARAAATRSRPSFGAGQLRAPPRLARAAGAALPRRARCPRCCSTSTPARTWRRCASASRASDGRAPRTRAVLGPGATPARPSPRRSRVARRWRAQRRAALPGMPEVRAGRRPRGADRRAALGRRPPARRHGASRSRTRSSPRPRARSSRSPTSSPGAARARAGRGAGQGPARSSRSCSTSPPRCCAPSAAC